LAFIRRTTNSIFYLLLISDVFLGVLRFVAAKIDLAPIIYLPKALTLFFPVLAIMMRPTVNRDLAFFTVLLFVSIMIGFVNLPSMYQSLFGMWVVVPFLFGYWGSAAILENTRKKTMVILVLFLSASFGVLLNTKIAFPWVGQSINVGGATVAGAKQWSEGGFQRYGGFALSSLNAAAQILCYAIWTLIYSRKTLLSVAVWLLCGVAILITTTKGIMLSYAILTVYFLTGPLIRRSKDARILWAAVLYVSLALDIGLPLYAYTHTIAISYHSLVQLLLFASFGDRLSLTWPGSLGLLSGPIQWLFGRGLGGIGDAQSAFEPLNAWPGDNIFVYLSVSVGVIATTLFLATFVTKAASAFINKRDHELAFPIALLVITYGLVVPVVDWVNLSVIFGAVYGGYINKQGPSPAIV